MGTKGLVRSIQAAQRSAQRDAVRRHNELKRQAKEYEKLQELERAAFEVQVYENHLELITSVHKDVGDSIDWSTYPDAIKPVEPKYSKANEEAALATLNAYKPGIMDKLLGREKKKRESLETKVKEAISLDEKEYKDKKQTYLEEKEHWEPATKIAAQVKNKSAEGYLAALEHISPFSEIQEIGTKLTCSIEDPRLVEMSLYIRDEDIVPTEVKSLSKTGKLLTKSMPKGQFIELYQDYVCGCALRCGREVFAAVPCDYVLIHALGNILNSASGHLEEQAFLSVLLPRETVNVLNYDLIDPSDSMKNFVHNMKFKKATGFEPVEQIAPDSVLNK